LKIENAVQLSGFHRVYAISIRASWIFMRIPVISEWQLDMNSLFTAKFLLTVAVTSRSARNPDFRRGKSLINLIDYLNHQNTILYDSRRIVLYGVLFRSPAISEPSGTVDTPSDLLSFHNSTA